MAKNRDDNTVNTQQKISEEYLEQIKHLHESDSSWGNRIAIPKKIASLIEQFNPSSILDFGCGKGHLTKALQEKYPDVVVHGWDPSRHSYSELPESVDMVLSTDVLEHIEPDFLDDTLSDLTHRTNVLMYHFIACYPAHATLPDGRNAHLIIENPTWWRKKFERCVDFDFIHEKITDEHQDRLAGRFHIIEYEVVVVKK